MASNKISLEELAANPQKFGLPTFQEYAKDPEKWRRRKDEYFKAIDKGTTLFGDVTHHHYFFRDRWGKLYDCDRSLEKVEQIAKNEGVSIEQLRVKPELREDHSTRKFIEVTLEDPRYVEAPKICLP